MEVGRLYGDLPTSILWAVLELLYIGRVPGKERQTEEKVPKGTKEYVYSGLVRMGRGPKVSGSVSI